MTPQEIETLFQEAIKERGVHNKLGVTKDVVYNYRNNRGNISFGDKLEALYKLNLIKISSNTINVSRNSKQVSFLSGEVGDEVIEMKNGSKIRLFRDEANRVLGNSPIPPQIETPEGFEDIKADWLNTLK